MREPEVLYVTSSPLVTSSTLTYLATRGELHCGLADELETHEHLWVLQVEDLASMLLRTMQSEGATADELGPCSQALMVALRSFVAILDEQGAYAR